MTSLLVVIGDALIATLGSVWSIAAGLGGHRRSLLVAVDVFGVAMPLSWAQSTHTLRFSNAVAVFCTVIVAALLMALGFSSGDALWAEVDLQNVVSFGSTLRAAPIVMLSLGCQVQVPSVYGELNHRTPTRMGGVLAGVGLTCVVLYSALAVAGVMVCGHPQDGGGTRVPGNVLDIFLVGDDDGQAMRMIMAFAVTLVYPMLCLPCRSTIDHLFFAGTASQAPSSPSVRLRFSLETVLIVSFTLFLEAQDHDLASVFGLTGATAGALICYILPLACFLRLRLARPPQERASTRSKAAFCIAMITTLVPLSFAITWQEWQAHFGVQS